MLKLTRKTEYALIALRFLQLKSAEQPLTARKISEIAHIPLSILSKVLHHLSKENLIETVKGAHGGYQLSVDLNKISLWNFLETMEGPLGLVDCLQNSQCNQEDNCSIITPISKIKHIIAQPMNCKAHCNWQLAICQVEKK